MPAARIGHPLSNVAAGGLTRQKSVAGQAAGYRETCQ
jgi:hypothetical protein